MPTCRVSEEYYEELVRLGKVADVRRVNAREIPELSEEEVEQHEKAFQKDVVDEAKRLGWFTFHHTISKKSKKGFPDLLLLRDRVVWIELKVPPNKTTAAQDTFIERIKEAGGEVHVFTPADWPQIHEVLNRRSPNQAV